MKKINFDQLLELFLFAGAVSSMTSSIFETNIEKEQVKLLTAIWCVVCLHYIRFENKN